MQFGIMQGRLTPSRGRGIQFFPFDNWKNEFIIAQEIGLQEIEWIFDYENFEENPLWSLAGQKEISEIQEQCGIKIRSVCFDYFMRRPFYKIEEILQISRRQENQEICMRVLDAMKRIDATLLEIPLVDNSRIANPKEWQQALEFIQFACDYAKKNEQLIGIETDLEPGKFLKFLQDVNRDNIRANFDSGNSSGLGYIAHEELESHGKYVANVHIKDRKYGNGTMKLGTGSADFDDVFASLKKCSYKGPYIMQAARGKDGEEKKEVMSQIQFVSLYLNKYRME